MTEAIKQWIEKQSCAEAIYEPKYGGKDHSGYDTMMKYEVNYERMDAFSNGLTKGIEIAEGFDIWKESEGYMIGGTDHEGIFFYIRKGDYSLKNIYFSQLLEKYLNQLEK